MSATTSRNFSAISGVALTCSVWLKQRLCPAVASRTNWDVNQWRYIKKDELLPSNRCQSWLFGDGQPADLPSITLTNINRGLVTSDEHGTSLALKSTKPFSEGPNRIVDCIQPLAVAAKAGNWPLPKRVCIPFFDGLPTEKRPVRSQQNRVLCEKWSQGSSIVFIICLVLLRPVD